MSRGLIQIIRQPPQPALNLLDLIHPVVPSLDARIQMCSNFHVKLPKYDGRHWKTLAPACTVGLVIILILVLDLLPNSNTAPWLRLLNGINVVIGFHAFFCAGRVYELKRSYDDLETSIQKYTLQHLESIAKETENQPNNFPPHKT